MVCIQVLFFYVLIPLGVTCTLVLASCFVLAYKMQKYNACSAGYVVFNCASKDSKHSWGFTMLLISTCAMQLIISSGLAVCYSRSLFVLFLKLCRTVG